MAEAQNDYARKRRGVHLSEPNKDTIHLPMQLSHSTVKCIQNNCTPTARLPPRSEGYLSSEGLSLSEHDEYHVHRQEQRQVPGLAGKLTDL